MSRLLAVDWGSSVLRGALLGAAGEFGAVFQAHFGDWMAAPGTRCLMAGMVGSRQGWVEAAYSRCPAGLDEVARTLTPVANAAGREIAIVAGVSCEHDGVPDVMRGEETAIFGALDLLGSADATLVLPGTHSKWVRVADSRIVDFSTVMSGEFYALLRRHSILARSLPAEDGALDGAAFDAGAARALAGPGLMQTAFSVRTLALFERLPAAALPSYLSGLVIGEELRGRALGRGGAVVVVGAPALAERFERALAQCGVSVRRFGEEAVWRGLWAIDSRRVKTGVVA
ncbi:MAG: 2-dehydro-3-deoxygalactonokinase [Caldimonas sp.]